MKGIKYLRGNYFSACTDSIRTAVSEAHLVKFDRMTFAFVTVGPLRIQWAGRVHRSKEGGSAKASDQLLTKTTTRRGDCLSFAYKFSASSAYLG